MPMGEAHDNEQEGASINGASAQVLGRTQGLKAPSTAGDIVARTTSDGSGGLGKGVLKGDLETPSIAESETTASVEAPLGEMSTGLGSLTPCLTQCTHMMEAVDSRPALMSKIKAFDEMREEERRRMFNAVVLVLYRLLGLGALLSAIGNVGGRFFLPDSYIPPAVLVVAFAFLVCGLVMGSVCPFDMLDFNILCQQHPKTTAVSFFACALVSLSQANYFPHLDLLEVIFCLGSAAAAWRRWTPSWFPFTTTFASLYFLADRIGWGLIFVFYQYNESLEMDGMASRVIGYAHLVTGAMSFAWWVRRVWKYTYNKKIGEEGGPCLACYEVLYAFLASLGFFNILRGVLMFLMPRSGAVDLPAAVLTVCRGVSIVTPAAVVMISGRNRLFNFLGLSFDRDINRIRRDGAFVAELLETVVTVKVGQEWWVHREIEDELYLPDDVRRNWRKGMVVTVENSTSEFIVQLPLYEEHSGRFSTLAASGSMQAPAHSFAGGPRLHLKQPSAGECKSKEDLLLQAQSELRCVEFKQLSPELMRRVDCRNNPALQAEWHSLSRPVRPGEVIDFFMSNSWYDDPEKKWEHLSALAERFQKKNGRYPTFWLDKLCIDQASITDGLKVLPVNVMACEQLLVLCGDTYLSRLWCIWELFTLFAFMSQEAALDRVTFVPLGNKEEGIKMLEGMAKFHVKDAHCYDPNEADLRYGTGNADAFRAKAPATERPNSELGKQEGLGNLLSLDFCCICRDGVMSTAGF